MLINLEMLTNAHIFGYADIFGNKFSVDSIFRSIYFLSEDS